MKNNKLTLFSTAALAVGAFLFLASNALAVDTRTKLDSDDSKFIQKEAAAGVALVRIAELGVKQAERADIRAFAGTIVAEHTKANAELAMLARNKGVALTAEADDKHADTFGNLADERGEKFDKKFLSTIVKAHEKCLKNYEDTAEDATDRELKMWVTTRIPVLQAHLDRAEQLSAASTMSSAAVTGKMASPDQTNMDRANMDRMNKDRTNMDRTNMDRMNKDRTMRDREAKNLTPFDQGNSPTDIATTAQIRKAIQSLDDISVNARNVKVITTNGHVTLRGLVNSEEEKRLIGEIANRNLTSGLADNQLEVKGSESTN